MKLCHTETKICYLVNLKIMYLDIKRLQQCNAIPMYTTGLENLLKNTKKKTRKF